MPLPATGGLLVGSDTLPSLPFRLYHLADTMVVVDPGRLEAAGFKEPLVDTRAGRIRFRARRPQAQTPRYAERMVGSASRSAAVPWMEIEPVSTT